MKLQLYLALQGAITEHCLSAFDSSIVKLQQLLLLIIKIIKKCFKLTL